MISVRPTAVSRVVILLAGFFCMFSFAPTADGAGADFAFSNSAAISGLRFEHVEKARFTEGGLLLRGNSYIKIGPPARFHMPARRVAMDMRFQSLKGIICNIRIKASNGRKAMKTVRVKVLEGNSGETRLRVYLGNIGRDGADVRDFVVAFYSGTGDVIVRLDSIRLYEPTIAELASVLWEEFWRPDYISGSTIAFVTTPEAGGVGFLTMLYVFTGAVFFVVLLVYRMRACAISRRRAAGAMVVIMLVAGVIFAVRMDYNWLDNWVDDAKVLSPATVDERIRIENDHSLDSFLDFINFMKDAVPPGRAVHPATIVTGSTLAAVARYYLLPIEESRGASLLWSYGEVLRLDPLTGALYDGKGALIAPRARLFAEFTRTAAIYEVF